MQGRTSVTAYLPNVKIPILLLCGEEDKLTPPEEMISISDKIPNSKYLMVPGSGHMTPIENSGFVNTSIKDFLSGLR